MSDLPPREPPDLRNNRDRKQQQGNQGNQQPYNNYPPQQQPPPQQYPPQQPPPQQGQWGQQQYPPQQQPPQQGQWGQQPPPPQQGQWGQQPPPNFDDRRGGTAPLNPAQPPPLGDYRSGNTGPLRAQSDFGSADLPQIRRSPGGSPGPFGLPSISEHRIEYLAWGIVVLLFGFSILAMTLDTDSGLSFIQVWAPIIAGVVLIMSGLAQRLLFRYSVSIGTWAFAVFCIAFGGAGLITRAQEDAGILQGMIYFVGLLVITSGLIIILQVFAPSER